MVEYTGHKLIGGVQGWEVQLSMEHLQNAVGKFLGLREAVTSGLCDRRHVVAANDCAVGAIGCGTQDWETTLCSRANFGWICFAACGGLCGPGDKPAAFVRSAFEADFGEGCIEEADGRGGVLGGTLSTTSSIYVHTRTSKPASLHWVWKRWRARAMPRQNAGCESHPPCASPSTTG